MGEVDGGHGFTVVFLCKKSEPIYDSSCVALLKVWCGGKRKSKKRRNFFLVFVLFLVLSFILFFPSLFCTLELVSS